GLFGVAGVGPSPWPVRVVRHRRRLAAHGKKAGMTTLRTHFTFRVDTWTPDGERIVEHIAGVEDNQVALAAYRAAGERRPGTPHHPAAGRASDRGQPASTSGVDRQRPAG